MKQLWLGLVEVMTEPNEAGNTKAFTNIVTWAEAASDFKERVERCFEQYGWSLIGLENCTPVRGDASYSEEVQNMIERARPNPGAVILGTFHRYPSKPV